MFLNSIAHWIIGICEQYPISKCIQTAFLNFEEKMASKEPASGQAPKQSPGPVSTAAAAAASVTSTTTTTGMIGPLRRQPSIRKHHRHLGAPFVENTGG
jgi:hypothetical protein